MSKGNDSRTIFTFRVASDEIKRIGTHLSGLTSQAKAVGQAIDAVQISIDKKRKELRKTAKRISERKKALKKLGKRAQEASLSCNVSLRKSTEGIYETTFAAEDASMVLSVMSSSLRKRKRFAGDWDERDVNVPVVNLRKRARIDVSTYESDESKENAAPTLGEAGPSGSRA